MCGRFTQAMSWPELWELLQLPRGGHLPVSPEPPRFAPRFNLAPSQRAWVGLWSQGVPRVDPIVWGVSPDWTRRALINATAERYMARRRSYWSGFARCVIPASGFYEWQATGAGAKQPMYIHRDDGGPLRFAGLWRETSAGPAFVIVTAPAGGVVAPIHARMPLILSAEDLERWSDEALAPPELADLLEPAHLAAVARDLRAQAVSRRVNDPHQDDPDLLRPLAERESPGQEELF